MSNEKPSTEGYVITVLLAVLSVTILVLAQWPAHVLAIFPAFFGWLTWQRAQEHKKAGH